MNNKITLQDLAQGLAKRKGLTKKDSESFIHKIFEVIEERVVTDGIVKIKGFGTFKINTVDSRESVNVNTGERFVIDTHSKISFTPHPTLRDAVNRPFSDFETVIISDDVKTEDMEYIPSVGDEGSSESEAPAEKVQPEPIAEEPIAEEPIAEEPIAEEPIAEEPIAEEPIAEEPIAEEPIAEEPIAEEPIAEEPIAEEPAEEPTESKIQNNPSRVLASEATLPTLKESPQIIAEGTTQTNELAEEKPESVTVEPTSSNKKVIIIAVVACLVVLCILCFVFWLPKKPVEGKAVNVAEQTAEMNGEYSAEKPAVAVKKELTPEEAAEKYPQVEGGEYLIIGTKEDYTIQKGDDLFKLSVGMYGDRKFAQYIIVYNGIKNPSHIEIGDLLKLPELRKKE